MAHVDTSAAAIAQLQRMKVAVREEYLDRLTDVVARVGYGRIIDLTEDSGAVDTGALRAANRIEQGGEVLYENPAHVLGDDEPTPASIGEPIYEGPDLGDVYTRVRAGLQFGEDVTFVNRRFYARDIEQGSNVHAPRAIYERSEDWVELYADSIARAPHQHPDLRGGRQ